MILHIFLCIGMEEQNIKWGGDVLCFSLLSQDVMLPIVLSAIQLGLHYNSNIDF